MGRRALRRVDPAIDLSNHLVAFEDLPRPWDSAALFGRTAPLEVEVGSGKGLFLLNAARQRPDVDFLGIEIVRNYAVFSASRLAKRDIPNALLCDCDAQQVFRELLPAEAVAAVHVYFPDPWWKSRHRRRRVMNAGFLAEIERTLQTGGVLHFWTDVEEYFHSTLELVAAETNLRGPFDVEERPAEHDLDYRTNYERRKRQREAPIYRVEFRK